MKKFKTFLPLAFIGICSFAASTSCDTGDRDAEATAALRNSAAGQLRGIDPSFIRDNPNATIGLPFSLIQGDTITFTPDPGSDIPASLNLSPFTVVAPNILRRGRTGAPLLGTLGDESSFTQIWSAQGTSTNPDHSDLTTATIELSAQHDWTQLGVTENAGLPIGYQELYDSSSNVGSINAAFREWACDSAISLAQLNIRQQAALNSIGLYAFNDTAGGNIAGPMVRRFQTLTLTVDPTTNAQFEATQQPDGSYQITGSYSLLQTYYQVNTSGSAILVIQDGGSTQDGCEIAFNPLVVADTAGFPISNLFTEDGRFTLTLSNLTLP